jgi:uncharacterized protein
VIATTLFYGYAFGLFYRIGPAVCVLFALAIYAVQVGYSEWWMARFRFGPMEWLWRTLTYGKAPEMLTPAAITSGARALGGNAAQAGPCALFE